MMKERELRRMNREALLELLIERTEEAEGLRAQLAEAQRALEAADGFVARAIEVVARS